MNEAAYEIEEKTIMLEDLQGKQFIRIGSKDNEIDFTKESTLIEVYFNDDIEPTFFEYAELHISEQTQVLKTGFLIPTNGSLRATVFIENYSNFDVMKVTAYAE